MKTHIVLIESGRLPIVSLSTGERKRTNQELSDYIARFPKAAGKLAADLLRNDRGLNHENTS